MHAIVEIEHIAGFIRQLRHEGDSKIAFTNGCFDILHRGHVHYLEVARSKADYLIVGLNSDKSVKRLKGSSRPYINQDDRAFILSRLESVDVVCIFEQDTPLELISLVKPDVLVKGGDYQVDEIVGREIVEQNGGKVCTVPLVDGLSTTNIMNKIKVN